MDLELATLDDIFAELAKRSESQRMAKYVLFLKETNQLLVSETMTVSDVLSLAVALTSVAQLKQATEGGE